MKNIRKKRSESIPVYLAALDAHGSMRTSVIRICKIDYFAPSGEFLCQLKCSLNRFAARVDKVTAAKGTRQNGCKTFGIFYLRRLNHLAIDHKVQVRIDLVLNRLYHFRVPVTSVADRNA